MRHIALIALLLATPVASAQTIKTFKHDSLPDDITAAANEINGKITQTEPGFVHLEGFGALFRPGLADYPLKVLSIDLLLSGPSGYPDLFTNADIEVYLDAGQGPKPNKEEPDFKVNTAEFYNPETGGFGVPLKGNIGYSFGFDYELEAGNYPPEVFEGNIIVMVRFTEGSQSLETEWGTAECYKEWPILCGCQPAGMILDPDAKTVPTTNIMHLVWPVGNCTGNMEWKFFENVTLGTKKLKGDAIIRLVVESSDNNTCNCAGIECGPDSCGSGSCGQCGASLMCQSGQCVSDCQPACGGVECGPDGCGGSCGSCGGDMVCNNIGKCEAKCAPACDNKECGDDGCGGKCGICGNAYECNADGTCQLKDGGTDGGGTTGDVVAPGDLSVTSISPNRGAAGEQIPVTISGTGFVAGATVRLGGSGLIAVDVLSDTIISATIDKVTAGSYDLFVLNKDGASATLPAAFTAEAEISEDLGGGSGAPSSGCQFGGGPINPLFGFMLLFAALMGLKRRRA